uniref:phage tail protein n=1 Tax=Oceanobacillus massiliensis TaxID=1465765 RepID=UPI003017C291
DPVARNQAGVALFGTMFEDLEGDAISAFSSIGTEASLSKDALGQINEIKFNSFGEALQVIGRNFKTALIEPIQTHVLPLLSQFAQWTVENMPAIQETMGTVFGIIGTLIGGLITGVQNLIVMLQTWFTNNQTIIESIKMGFTTLVEIVSGLIQQFVTFFQTKISEILSWWNTNGAMIVQAFKNVFNVIKTVIKVALAIALPIVQGFISGIKNIISGGLNFIMGLITAFSGLFTGNWGKMWSGLKQMVSGALQAIWGFFQTNLMGRVVGLIGGFASRAVGLFRGFGSNVSGIVSSVVSKVVGFFGNLVSRIQSRVKSGFNSVKDFIVKPIEKARDLIRAAVDKIIGFFTGIGKKLKIDIPKPKLPRFSLNGKFSLKPPSVPKIGLEWHKNGGFFDQPTIAGLGEAGKEAIVPLVGNQMNPFADAVAQRMDNKTQTNNNQNVTVSPVFNYTVNGKVDEKELKRHADYTTKQINKELKDLGLKF